MFLVYKGDGRVKSRVCIDYRKQRDKIIKKDTAYTTVTLESIMITSGIYSHEEHDVATIEFPGAYLHNMNDKYVIMLLRVRLAGLMAMVDPNLYLKYVTTDQNSQTLIYVKVLKALYCLLNSALPF